MLKIIKDILKTMGGAFTFAHAGEMLSAKQKAEILGRVNNEDITQADEILSRVVLAGDKDFSSEVVETAITLCDEKNAILDLLCVSTTGNKAIVNLGKVLTRLESETNLDFQVTRRHGDLLTVTKSYLHSHQDTLTLLIYVGERLRKRSSCYMRMDKWLRTNRHPDIRLMGDILHV